MPKKNSIPPEFQNPLLIEALKRRLEEAIKSKEDTIALPVEFKANVGSRILISSTLYESGFLGKPVYVIDCMSQHGFLNLVDVMSLIEGDVHNIHKQDLGTYNRNEKHQMTEIFLNITGKDNVDLNRIIFDQPTLQHMLEQDILYTYGGGGGGNIQSKMSPSTLHTIQYDLVR